MEKFLSWCGGKFWQLAWLIALSVDKSSQWSAEVSKDGLSAYPSIFGDQSLTHWPPWTRTLNNRPKVRGRTQCRNSQLLLTNFFPLSVLKIKQNYENYSRSEIWKCWEIGCKMVEISLFSTLMGEMRRKKANVKCTCLLLTFPPITQFHCV